MVSRTVASSDDTRLLTLRLLDDLFGGQGGAAIGARLWDGTLWPDDRPRRTTLVLKSPGSLRAMLLPGTELGLAEAYLYDDFDIEGEMEPIFALADGLAERTLGWQKKLSVGRELLKLPRREACRTGRGPARSSGKMHTLERDRKSVTYHYDVSNDFFGLWLDRRMVYSCAYFQAEDEALDAAQEQKLDLICRKLRLKAGQRLLDIGCGWGALVIHAARHYGVDATGITLSRPQAELASKRIAAEGLQDRCRVEVRDYRQMDEGEGFDALASIGMFEHVGAALLPEYFEKAFSLLKPGGVFLNHGIASSAMDPPPKGPTFTEIYVFPDGELVPIHVTVRAAEEAGFEVRGTL